ncbi:hypothetical protein DH2020_005417 [Rehmannia glutinosa]|uniref:Peptidase S8/S53 domain-containing protein n=1 Tax=Rehmannia glutinosa TaxID=99300 RepID=A0ABR0XFX4_REHGL
MPPPPAKWKGKCEFNFTACNNKLIGARYFTYGNGTPMDEDGHGTHTASTAAGNFVAGANYFGQANGTAVGIAPLAHLAVYKVCSGTRSCSESDVLAAMDVAIEDGVDVLSLSLGWRSVPFTFDAVALGAYAAMQKGIFVSCSAMNSGPSYGTLSNVAPWILTVGASTTDRRLRATVVLGNKEEIDARQSFSEKLFPVLPTIREVNGAGGAAIIFVNQEPEGDSKVLPTVRLPTTLVGYADGLKIKAYMNSTSTPMATLSYKGTVIGDDRAQ